MNGWKIAAAIVALGGAIAIAALAATGRLATWTETKTFPRDVADALAKLEHFDAKAYARAAADKGDFRIAVGSGFGETFTPGILCSAVPKDRRTFYVTDVVDRSGQYLLDNAIATAAGAFNRTLVADPHYPDKDICFASDEHEPSEKTARMAQEPARRSKVIDLATAVRAQDAPAVRRFIAEGAPANDPDKWDHTPLMWAASRPSLEILDALLAAGARTELRHHANSALVTALQAANIGATRRLLEAGPPELGNEGDGGWYPHPAALLAAMKLGRPHFVRLIFEFKALPESSDTFAWRQAIQAAIEAKCVECVTIALNLAPREISHHAGLLHLVDQLNREGETATAFAIVVAARGEFGRSASERRVLLAAAQAQNRDVLAALLRGAVLDPGRGQDLNLLTPAEATELVSAVARNDAPVIERLFGEAVSRRAKIEDAIREHRVRDLMAAIPKGASLDQINARTPLMMAASLPDADMVEALVELGSPVNAELAPGESALYFAILYSQLANMRVLIDRGAHVDEDWTNRASMGMLINQLDKFQPNDRKAAIALILNAPPATARERRLAVMASHAVSDEQMEAMSILLSEGVDPCGKDAMGHELIRRAAYAPKVFALLTKRCGTWSPASELAGVILKDILDGSQPISAAKREIERSILEAGVPLPVSSNYSPMLCDAARYGDPDQADLLLKFGADINELRQGGTALDCAKPGSPIVAYLRKHGAKTAAELGIAPPPPPPFPF